MFPKNPFVILQLPANATSAEIRAAGQKAIATMRLESSQNISAIREVEGAIEALRDPVLRFTTGLHWISLGSEAAKLLQSDPEFEKLSERPRIDRGPAIDRLLKDEIKHCKDHGQAVFSLMRAYALLSSKPSNDEISKGTKLLGVGIAAWIRATNAPEFWLAQRFRAREINDPRVGAELLKKCQESAIDSVFQPFIELAIESLRAHNGQLCKSIVQVLMNCNVDKSTTDRLMGQVFEQFCRNLEGVVSLLATRLKSIKAADRVAPFQDLFDDYVAQVDPKIDLLLFIGDLPGTSEERVRDAAALFLLRLAVEAPDDAIGYRFSIGALTLADKSVYSPTLREKLILNTRIIVSNQKNLNTNANAEDELKRKEELLATIAAALVRNDYKTALKILDEIIARNPASSVAERNRRAQIATLWATELYNSGIRQINAGYSAAGQSFLEEAASIESNPTELAKINRALTALRGGARKAAAPQASSRNANDERELTYQQLKVATSRNDKSQSLLLIERLLLGATEEEASRLRKLHESIERGFVSPISFVPPLYTFNGFGTTVYGDSICIVALFIPIFWLGRYKVEHLLDGRYSFQGKRRLQTWQVIFNWCVAVGTVVLIVLFNVSG